GNGPRLGATEAYNRDATASTLGLHRWLVGVRPDLPWALPPAPYVPQDLAAEAAHERVRVQASLRERGEPLLADLLDFPRRDAKPAWWEWFRRLDMDERELVEDSEAIGGIERLDTPPEDVRQSFVYELSFPPQEFKVGSAGIDPATERPPGTILSIDETRGRIRLRRSKKR